MKIALFGGTFDPVHRGHLAVARAAAKQFKLDLIYFAPADIPPHKQKRELTDFRHRFAMLALATAGDKRFVVSLVDAPTGRPNYSVDTVRRLRSSLGKRDKLYFLIGMDAFKDIGTWREPVKLLASCEFIVARRPGHSLADVARALPKSLRLHEHFLRGMEKHGSNAAISTREATIHMLDDVNVAVSSTEIRAAARKSTGQLSRLVPRAVAEYIRKQRLYMKTAVRTKTRKAR